MPDQDHTTDALLGRALRVILSRELPYVVRWPNVDLDVDPENDTADVVSVDLTDPDALRALIRDLGADPVEVPPESEAVRLRRDLRRLNFAPGDVMKPEFDGIVARVDAFLARQGTDPWGGVTPAEVASVLRRIVAAGVASYGPKGCGDAADLLARIPEPRPEEGGGG